MTKCPLCLLDKNRRTIWYHEDDVCVVCDCDTCTAAGKPSHIMIVLRRHTMEPTQKEMKHMLRTVKKLNLKVTRWKPRRIKHHLHYHCRFLPLS